MTTCTQNAQYTEADVEQACERMRSLIKAKVVSANEEAALEVLLGAALEGAKVPGLVSALEEAVLKVATLQARVADLERQGLDMARQVGDLSGEVDNLTSERDALRALVASTRDAFGFVWGVARDQYAALSATPAEMTPVAKAPLLCEVCSKGGKRSHAACGTPECECFCNRVRVVTGAQARALVESAETPPALEGTSARPYRMLSALDVRPTVPPVLPLSERVRQSLVKLGHEPTPLTTAAADALHPSGRCTCAGEGTCAWCRARCDACGSPYIPEAVRHALSQVWSALHVTTAHQGVAVAVLRAVYPELPVPDGDEGTEAVKLLRSRMAATVEGALGMRKPPEALSYQDVVMMAQACKAALSDMLDRHDLSEPARDRIALVHNSLVDVWQGVAFLQHLAGSAMVRAVRDAARLGAEDMRERASKAVVSANAPRRGTFDIARAVRDLPLPGEEVPRG